MKFKYLFLCLLLLSACTNSRPLVGDPGVPPTAGGDGGGTEPPSISQSLFEDKTANISEENIRKVLDGQYALPQKLRVAIMRLEPSLKGGRYSWGYNNDEQYLKTQQSYLDLFSGKFRQSGRVAKISPIPDLILSKTPTYTSIREAAVRMQADVVVIYAITSDLYAKYRLFTKTDIKAFATTQLIVLDVRTGLVPFSAIVTRDVLSQKKADETGFNEASVRIQNEAVLLTIEEIGQRIAGFLNG